MTSIDLIKQRKRKTSLKVGINPKTVAKKLGVNISTVTMWLRMEKAPSPENQKKLEEHFPRVAQRLGEEREKQWAKIGEKSEQ